MKKLFLGLAIHNHQPVDNYPWVFAEVYKQAYLPLVDALERHPQIRLSLHYSGSLLEWLEENRPHFLNRLAALVKRGQAEMMTGGCYEPILPVIPDADKSGQIRRLTHKIQGRFGQVPSGLWLAERVWEPNLPKPLAKAGVKWTIVDDTHFKLSGLEDKDLFGYYLTEEEGFTVKVFASSKRLRYLIPWRDVPEVIDYFRQEAIEEGARIAVMGDDGEKFGAWPETYVHCWEKGWMETFLAALEQNSEWLVTMPLGEYAARFPPLGQIYLPTAAYAEMMEWALPTATQVEFSKITHEMENAHREDVVKFLRGGYWRNFLSKYPEVNNMHKKMLRVHRKVHQAESQKPGRAALEELWKGQNNCGYWHGVFGGAYLSDTRQNVFRHLIMAENSADALLHPDNKWIDCEMQDFDADGSDELLVTAPPQNLYFDLSEGGSLFEWDLRRVPRNIGATISRRPEAYHQKLLELEARQSESSQGDQGVKTIHELVRTKEAKLSRHLHYDWYRRTSLIDHFLAPQTTLEDFARCSYEETGDFVKQPYGAHTERTATGLRLHLQRQGSVRQDGALLPFRVVKEIDVPLEREGIRTKYRLTNLSDQTVSCRFGSEWNLSLRNQKDGARFRTGKDGEWVTATPGDSVERVTSLVLPGAGFELSLELSTAASLWFFPLETVSSSESGFELSFQGNCLLFAWPFSLNAGASKDITLAWDVSVTQTG